MASIGVLAGKFDGVRTNLSEVVTRLDEHTGRLDSLAREATSNRADLVELVRSFDERALSLIHI